MSVKPYNTRRGGRPATNTENLVGKDTVVSDNTAVGRVKRTAFGEIGNRPVEEVKDITAKKRTALGDIANVSIVKEEKAVVVTRQVRPEVAEVAEDKPILNWIDRLPEYDRSDVNDTRFVSEYVNELFAELWATESTVNPCTGDYMFRCQSDLNDRMRGVLIDWIVEVHWKFKLYPETLLLCVNLLDRFLAARPNIPRSRLQLVGVTCLLIAAKYEDIYAPENKDIVHICDKTYTKEDILAMEVCILNTLGFRITTPSPLLFLLRLAKVARCDERQFYLAQYCLELAMPNYSLWTNHSSSQLAAATLYLSNKLLRRTPGWPEVLKNMCGHDEATLKPIAKEMCLMLQAASSTAEAGSISTNTTQAYEGADTSVSGTTASNPAVVAVTRAIKKKFSQAKHHSVAKLVL